MTRVEEMVELIRKAQHSDPEAYAEIVLRFQDMAYGYAYAVLNDFQMAQDAAQEAFIEAYACLPSLREATAFPVWFKRIVFKHCDRMTRRKHPTFTPLEGIEAVVSPQPGPAEITERREFANLVQEAILDLPVQERVVTTLFYIDGYSQKEIGDFLDVPAKTIKSRLHASRQRLKERMLEMVQDELKANALPEGFTGKTLEQAVLKAGELNKGRQFDQAEVVLRQVLANAPEHPGALKELNRTLMWGSVYGQGRWDLLPELVRQGQVILKASDDETVHMEIARTLLAVPAMTEAIAFINKWVKKKGPNLERLGMLAWAQGCTGDNEAAEATWQAFILLARASEAGEVMRLVPFACYTLVDCFSTAGELPRAQATARQAWELCSNLGSIPSSADLHGDSGWLRIFYLARLDYGDMSEVLLERCNTLPDLDAETARLSLRVWLDEPQHAIPTWMTWIQNRIASKEWQLIEHFRTAILWTLRLRGFWADANQLAQMIWETLGKSTAPEAQQTRISWDWERFNPLGAIQSQDWHYTEQLSRREMDERGLQAAGPWAIVIAAAQGTPTPVELVQAVEKNGLSSVDEYGLFGWYLIAREAAAAGGETQAFAALRKSLAYWSNPPYGYDRIWENDLRWGSLRHHAEFKRLFAEKRQRIGPIYGQLHYFPGW